MSNLSYWNSIPDPGEIAMSRTLAAFLLIVASNHLSVASGQEWVTKTYLYKTVGDVEIHADFSRPGDEVIRPLVVWIHGGALIMGDRNSVPRNLRELCQTEGYALIALDYRLAPEVKLPEIIADLRDAFAWIRKSAGNELHVNPDKMVVCGGSAGGYLTLMTGVILAPPPAALVSYYGYGDVDGDWYVKPSEHYRTTANLVPEEQARSVVGKKILTGTSGPDPIVKRRFEYYLFLRQNGLWTREVTGFDPATEKTNLDPYCPVRNVTPKYPPTLLIHGTADTDVPYQLSVDMELALTAQKVPHEFITVENGDHGLSTRNTTADPAVIQAAHTRALAFIRERLTQ